MKYYKLLYDYENDSEYIFCRVESLYEFDRYELTKGKIIDNWNTEITFYYDPNEGQIQTDFLGNDLGWLIVSQKVKDLFQSESIQGIQYLPLRIVNVQSAEEIKDYFVVNICNMIDALDLEASKYFTFELGDRKILSIQLYALKEHKLNDCDVFKLNEHSIPTFISENIVELMKQQRISGCDYLEIRLT